MSPLLISATGSGKTYTMLGDDKEPGVMIHTLRDLVWYLYLHFVGSFKLNHFSCGVAAVSSEKEAVGSVHVSNHDEFSRDLQ